MTFVLHDVARSYGKTEAVKPTNLTVAEGQTTVLIGPSGCGKSTLLRLMIGLIRPTAGWVEFEGEALKQENLIPLRHKMGYVIQDGGLFPNMTAQENATLMARHLRWPAEKIQARLDELTALTHFPKDGLRRYPLELSGGQRQRVSLMRALMLDPDVLLLDEPLGALDPMIRADLQAELRDIFRTLGKTVVMVTHDLGEAAYFAHTIVLMRAGEVLQKGLLKDLTERPATPFVREFVQSQRSPLADLEEAGG
jgi:osmoprotectant transport system ATP-binding protein